ncbi:hypothetical protein VPNG_01123 [Cytospora leucostoma]|uniref:Apc15p protein n=1 Tax=Cytospora leucostoma TaxID=1230097 RepID=A0A423XL04_9PEZI|nr:hypothetical protein VPNG_01123 [Cytospora leucostoma]
MPMLPDLTPRDSHSLWYTSRHAPSSLPHHLISPHDPSTSSPNDAHQPNGERAHQQHHGHPSRDRRALVERTPLARLRFEEQLMERRRLNVSNFGSAWLKPPGVPKTLFQMREERREAEEHAEAVRREQQLAASMAEAETEGATGEDEMDESMMGGGGEGEEVQDLDDDIPEAEGFGFDGDDSEDEDDDETVEEEEQETEDDDDEDASVTGTRNNAGVVQVSPAERRDMRDQVRGMRAEEVRVREVMARGPEGGLVVDDDADDDEEERAGMLEEDDLVHEFDHADIPGDTNPEDSSIDMDMDADLDGGIPEGVDDGYEHTDSEAEISEDGTHDLSFAPPPSSRFRRSLPRSSMRGSVRGSVRASMAQSELDVSGLLSRDGSSFLEGSPHDMRRRGV